MDINLYVAVFKEYFIGEIDKYVFNTALSKASYMMVKDFLMEIDKGKLDLTPTTLFLLMKRYSSAYSAFFQAIAPITEEKGLKLDLQKSLSFENDILRHFVPELCTQMDQMRKDENLRLKHLRSMGLRRF